jgi:hypothetical protein
LALSDPLIDLRDCLLGLRADARIELVEAGFKHLGIRSHLVETGLSPFNEYANATLYWALLTHNLNLIGFACPATTNSRSADDAFGRALEIDFLVVSDHSDNLGLASAGRAKVDTVSMGTEIPLCNNSGP